MIEIDLFSFWALSISFSTVFLTVISIYLFMDSKTRRIQEAQKKAETFKMWKNFAFVFVLVGLLIFYIFSIQLGSGILPVAVFTIGNVIVEILLILYLLRNAESQQEIK